MTPPNRLPKQDPLMLASIRRSAKSWAAGAILFIALVAIVITGFGTGGFGGLGSLSGPSGGGETLASVDGETLSEQEVADIVNRQYSQARQQQPDLDMAAFIGSGFNDIVDQMVLALAVQAFGAEQGLTVTQRMVDREIVNIEAFRNFAGRFDENAFRAALANQNITEAQLRQDIGRSLMQRQLLGPVARGAAVPEGVAREYANLLLERRRGAIGVVPAELLREGPEPGDAELTRYYNANRGRFTLPERRIVKYALIGPEQVAAAAAATDQEIADFYRRNAAAFGPRETRNLQSIVLPDQAAARAFAERVRGGTGFIDAAGEAEFSAADVTFAGQSREQFAGETNPAVAAAAFQAQQGAVIGPIRSELGYHVVRVDAVNRIPARPLAAVRDQIARGIQQRKLTDALGALVTRVEDRLAEGASLEEVARAERLTVTTTPPITETGQAPGQSLSPPPELQPLLRAAFEIDAEDPEPVVEQIEPNQRFALLGLERVFPAAPPPLAEVRTQVRDALVRERGLRRARALADQIAARINRGMAAALAFAQAQPRMPPPETVDLQRLEISRAGASAPAPLIALFSLPQGRAHVLEAPNGAGYFVIHHTQRTPGNAAGQPALIATTRTEFAASAGEELAQQFARAVELASEVERNPQAIASARQRLLANTGQ